MIPKRSRIFLYYYIRYSLLVYVVALVFGTLYFLVGFDIPKYIETIYFAVVICCFPAFFILPGIIYEGNYRGMSYGVTIDQFKYSLFLGLSLGLGPLLLYFLKYDKLFKSYVFNHEEDIRKSNRA